MNENLAIWEIIEERGVRQVWLAQKLGVSEAHVSLLRSGKRRWTSELQNKAAQVLMLPRSVLFLSMNSNEVEISITDVETATIVPVDILDSDGSK
jgi:transcriptional regulator with XRE-family HTH domain